MKKLVATILTIVMLTGIAGVVPAFADTWTPTSSDDGYTKVLADYDMESLNGIIGTQKMKYPEISDTLDTTTDWTAPSDANSPYFSIVSATDANLPDAAQHGNVIKHTGPTISTTGTGTANNSIYTHTATSDSQKATKAVMQVDMYIDEMPNNCIEVLSANVKVDGSNKWNASTLRFMPDGVIKARYVEDGTDTFYEVGTFTTKRWYTVTVALDVSSENRSFSAWLDDELIVDNKQPGGNLATCSVLRHFNLYMSWLMSETVEIAPAVYWDNMRVYTGDVSVSGSPRYADTEILGATAIDSPIENDGHGKVLSVVSPKYFVKAVTNPIALDSEYALTAPSAAKLAEYGQVKLEADVYYNKVVAEDEANNSKARVGVRYVNSTGAEADLDIISMDEYESGWYNIVVYVDSVNGKYTSYVNGTIVDDDVAISDTAFTAPRAMYVSCKATTVYADNMKFSVPEYYSANGGGIAVSGEQKMLYPGIDCDALDSVNDWEKPDTSFLSITTAADAGLTFPVTHGNVIKHVGPSGTIEASANNSITTKTIEVATKAVMQADVYIDTMTNNFVDLFNVAHKNTANKTVWSAETVRFYADGTIKANTYNKDTAADEFVDIGTFATKKWYTVTVELDVASSDRTISVWLDGTKVLDKATPCDTLNNCTSLRSFKFALSWLKGEVENAPVVYWDNVKSYTGSDASVSGIVAPVFVQTRQGAEKYSLAYMLESDQSSKAVLIAAVYDSTDLLSRVTVDETASELADGECELLLTEYELKEGEILGKMLWKDFATLKPLMENE